MSAFLFSCAVSVNNHVRQCKQIIVFENVFRKKRSAQWMMVHWSYITGQIIHTEYEYQAHKWICILTACQILKGIHSSNVAHLATYQSLLWGNWATWLKCLLLAATGEQAFSWSPSAPAGLKVAWQSCSPAAQILQWLTVADRMEQLSIQIYSLGQESRPANHRAF